MFSVQDIHLDTFVDKAAYDWFASIEKEIAA